MTDQQPDPTIAVSFGDGAHGSAVDYLTTDATGWWVRATTDDGTAHEGHLAAYRENVTLYTNEDDFDARREPDVTLDWEDIAAVHVY